MYCMLFIPNVLEKHRLQQSKHRTVHWQIKLIVNGMVRDDLQNFDKTDLRFLATLHNVA